MAFDFIIYLSGICGFVMVCGAIWLLRTGVIELSEAGKSNAFSLEIEKKIKLSTSYPALALFIIGLIFVVVAMVLSKPHRIPPLKIVGKLDLPAASKISIRVSPESWSGFYADSDGGVIKTFDFDFDHVRVEIEAEGYAPRPFAITRRIESEKREVLLPENLNFVKLDTPIPASGEIAPLPADIALAPFEPIED